MKLDEVIYKYFKDDRTRFYKAPDRIDQDNYMRYRYEGDRVIITVGSNEGELDLFVIDNPELLDKILHMVIYQEEHP